MFNSKVIIYMLIAMLVGCGGGGTSGTGVTNTDVFDGVVTDANGNPLSGAKITLKDHNIEITSNEDGSFLIDVPENEPFILVVTFDDVITEIPLKLLDLPADIVDQTNEPTLIAISGDGAYSVSGDTPVSNDPGLIDPVQDPCDAGNESSCGKERFCDYIDLSCGRSGGQGVCRTRPEVCILIYEPVCGCDNKTYSNYCDAQGAGVSVLRAGEC